MNQHDDQPRETGRKLDKQLLLKILAETTVGQKEDEPKTTSLGRRSNLPEIAEDSEAAKTDS